MKKHGVLAELEQQLEGIDRTFTKVIGPMQFKMRVLRRAEETKARSLVKADNILAAFAESNVPQLAFALQSINDVPTEQLFEPDTDDEKKLCEVDPGLWRAGQVADWIASRDTNITEQLWMAYLEAKDAVNAGLAELEDFSKRTPSGG